MNLPFEPAILVGFALLTIMSHISAAIQTMFSGGVTSAQVKEVFRKRRDWPDRRRLANRVDICRMA